MQFDLLVERVKKKTAYYFQRLRLGSVGVVA